MRGPEIHFMMKVSIPNGPLDISTSNIIYSPNSSEILFFVKLHIIIVKLDYQRHMFTIRALKYNFSMYTCIAFLVDFFVYTYVHVC